MRTSWKPLLIQLCGQIFIIGGTVTAMLAALFLLDPNMLSPSDVVVEPATKLLALPFLSFAVCSGFLAGLAAWICAMRPFSHRAQLYQYLTEPYIPVASDLMGWVFDLVYDTVRKPYRLDRPWR